MLHLNCIKVSIDPENFMFLVVCGLEANQSRISKAYKLLAQAQGVWGPTKEERSFVYNTKSVNGNKFG